MVIHTTLILYCMDLLADTPRWDRFLSSFRQTMVSMLNMGFEILASFDGRRVTGKRENLTRAEERNSSLSALDDMNVLMRAVREQISHAETGLSDALLENDEAALCAAREELQTHSDKLIEAREKYRKHLAKAVGVLAI